MTIEQNGLALDIEKVVRDYFYNHGCGRCEPSICYHEYDIKKYTFRMISMTLNTSVDYCMPDNSMDMDSFRREVRLLLKRNGFTKCKFDTKKITYKGGAFGDQKFVRLNAIYFDR